MRATPEVNKPFVLSAQLTTTPGQIAQQGLAPVLATVRQAAEAGQLAMLMVGLTEIPALYQALTARETRPTGQVFLWHPALSDYPGMQPEHRVIDDQGAPSAALADWTTQESAGETFQFACPNNPEARAVSLGSLERLLLAYDFDGVFLDKIRFPSPANGVQAMRTCFCPHCQEAAAATNLDLEEVRRLLASILGSQPAGRPATAQPSASTGVLPGAPWLDALLAGLPPHHQELLARFLRFRAGSITRFAGDVAALAHRLGRQLALDLFSRGLALLVGQDYPALASLAAWIKPMTYRYARGPAGLRLEIPALVRGLSGALGICPEDGWRWVQDHISGMEDSSLAEVETESVPLALIEAETRAAVQLAGQTPIHLGVEAVTLPAFQIITPPQHVRNTIDLARQAGCAGAVLSWDVLSMPLENLQAAREAASPGFWQP